MKLDNISNVNRLLIYFFYDADGIVDRYVPYMLEALREYCSEIFVICNGKLTPEGRKALEKTADEVYVRENKGFDVWAYKTALEHYGWDKLAEYDEVIMMNYSLFGPLYSFDDMFKKMNAKDVDFWGITMHHRVDFDCWNTCKYKYIPEHIQSSFLVIRRSLINTLEYKELWEKMPMINSYAESVGLYEAVFTKEFNEKGFKSDVYIDTSDLRDYTRYPLMMMADELIINRKCPVMKIKSFTQNYYDILTDTIGNCTIDAFDYIKDNLTYDTDMMLEHVLRVYNMADIKKLMHLNYILPRDHLICDHDKIKKCKLALMMHLYFADLIDYCLNYAKSMPDGSDLIITVSSKKMEKEVNEKIGQLTNFKNIKIIVIENVGRDVSSLLVGCAPYIERYDYICFVHDKKTTQVKPYSEGRSFSYKLFEDNLSSKNYVLNVVSTFEKNPRLGIACPPPPNHGMFYDIVGFEWANDFENTLSLATEMNLKCNITWQKEPIAPLGTMFWFRSKALKPLIDKKWQYKDFPKEPNGFDGTLLHAIERIYPYIAQSAGYYSAWIMTDRNARIEITNLYFMLRELNAVLLSHYPTNNLQDMVLTMQQHMFFKFSKKQQVKNFIKKITPKPIWSVMRSMYHKLNGKKWLGGGVTSADRFCSYVILSVYEHYCYDRILYCSSEIRRAA